MKSTNNQDHESPCYDRETLYREVWEEPMIRVAKRYGVSDVALTKTCKKLRLPKPGLGYWAKKTHGHETEKPPLPDFSDPPKILRRGAQKPAQPTPERELFEDRLVPEAFKKAFDLADRENEADMKIKVPDELTITHPFLCDAFSNRDMAILTGEETSYSVPLYSSSLELRMGGAGQEA